MLVKPSQAFLIYRLIASTTACIPGNTEPEVVRCRIGKERLDALHKEVGVVACQKLIKVLREDLRRASDRLKAKFDSVFEEENGVMRVWSARLDIPTIAKEANIAAVKLLAQLTLAPKRAGLLVPGAADEDVKKAKVCPHHSGACTLQVHLGTVRLHTTTEHHIVNITMLFRIVQ
jgi:hypothetical protein